MNAETIIHVALTLVLGALGTMGAVIGYFLRSLHSEFRDHVNESNNRYAEFVAVKSQSQNTAETLEKIDSKLDRLIEKLLG